MFQNKKSSEIQTHTQTTKNKLKRQYSQLYDANAVINLKTKGSRFVLSKLYPYYFLRQNTLIIEYISDQDLRLFFDDLNKTIAINWPSQKLITLSYMLIPFSCGFSLLCPFFSFERAEKQVQLKLDEYNHKWESRGIRLYWDDDDIQIQLFNKNKVEDEINNIDIIVE
ncbi:unnamed protein product (macronuclear) [Paramecium tetraurelia]|uniref:Uncharacterized protein n=1 Tax=Paramecium tetraurelia TaxID=5888 RepID=A0DPM8_PARTE|nr:uncharacterized protein GSPATT00019177001 [Paramecium tetraurelia]CAK84995.1 unnamed protein product [Paramecium tetraurelia]|eukprot:XP_001452392.1 hypothetical protein (macronuclear) [Paramecium tetraurelia strain d4-2]